MEKARWAAKKWKNGNVQSRRKIALARATDVGALHVLHLIVYLKEMLFAQTLFFIIMNHILFSFFIPILVINRVSKRNKFILN